MVTFTYTWFFCSLDVVFAVSRPILKSHTFFSLKSWLEAHLGLKNMWICTVIWIYIAHWVGEELGLLPISLIVCCDLCLLPCFRFIKEFRAKCSPTGGLLPVISTESVGLGHWVEQCLFFCSFLLNRTQLWLKLPEENITVIHYFSLPVWPKITVLILECRGM